MPCKRLSHALHQFAAMRQQSCNGLLNAGMPGAGQAAIGKDWYQNGVMLWLRCLPCLHAATPVPLPADGKLQQG